MLYGPLKNGTRTIAGFRQGGKETVMEIKKVLAGWSKICPGCNIGRKYPDSFIGTKVRNHWGKGCISHNAYVEVYGGDEPSPKKSEEKLDPM
jgi:multimeric flavodoxin WrbA